MKAVPRLALDNTRSIRKPERHLKALEAWAERWRGFFPEDDGCPHWHAHLAVDERLVNANADVQFKRRALKALLDAARHVAASPSRRGQGTVYVAWFSPNAFMSEVGVFLDKDYARSFERRTSPDQIWTRLPDRSVAADYRLALPAGFVERGYHELLDEGDGCFEREIWMIREPIPGT